MSSSSSSSSDSSSDDEGSPETAQVHPVKGGAVKGGADPAQKQGCSRKQKMQLAAIGWCFFWIGMGIQFALRWDGTVDKEIPIWLNVGLCRNSENATANMYGSAQWLGPVEYVAEGNKENCKVPKPTYGLKSVSKLGAKHVALDFPWYPRIYATDFMNIKKMTITLKNDQTEQSQTWEFSAMKYYHKYFSTKNGEPCESHTQCISGNCTKGKCVVTTGNVSTPYKPFTKKGRLLVQEEQEEHKMLRRRRLLKGGQSRPAQAAHVVAYRGRDDPREDSIESDNALPYEDTEYGGARRRIVDVTDAGMIFSIYSSTPMLGERVELGDTYAVDGSDEKLSNYDNKYNNIDKCDDHNNGCEVKLFSSFSLFDLNGLGIFYTETTESSQTYSRSDSSTYSVTSVVEATYDELFAAKSKEAKYTVEFPKIFVTFATEKEDPMAALWGTCCVLSFIMVFFPGFAFICCKKKANQMAYTVMRKDSTAGPIQQPQIGITEIPNEYRKLVDPFANLQTAVATWVAMDESDDDYTTTNVSGHNIGRVNYLDITNNDIASITNLQAMPNLYHLNISNNNLKNVNGIQAAKNLRKLEAHDNYLTSLAGLNNGALVSFAARRCDLISIQGCNASNLQYLDCADNDITGTKGISEFTTPLLRVLNLSNNGIEDITSLSRLSYLEAICLSSNDINDANNIVNIINTCTKIRYVDVRNNDLNHLNGINSKTLEVLYANSNAITKLDNIFAPALQLLDCTDNNINQITALGVSSTPMLATLNLGTNNLRDVSELCGLQELTTLSLVDNELEDSSSVIEAIKTCLNLKELKINHNVVTKESLEVVINELVATNEFKRSAVHIT